MRKIIKLIDLFNKMANGEELPKKIEFCFTTFEYNGVDDYICIDENNSYNGYSIHKWIFGNCLNDKIEILEEEKKLPEKLGKIEDNDGYIDQYDVIKIGKKVDEIIGYLENKGD